MKYKGVDINEIVLYKHPLLYLELCVLLVIDFFKWLPKFIAYRIVLILGLSISWALVNFIPELNVFIVLF